MTEIAAAMGVSKATVSLALRNDPRVAKETREKARKIAEKMGYQPNPLIQALMAQRRAPKARAHAPTIGVLYTGNKNTNYWFIDAVMKSYAEGVRARCAELGFATDEIQMDQEGVTTARLQKLLLARGIRGLFLVPATTVGTPPQLDWSHFACSTLGYTWQGIPVHRSTAHQFANLQLAFKTLRQKGYERIGLVLSEWMDVRIEYQWSGAYLAAQAQLPSDQRLAIYSDSTYEQSGLQTWLEANKPDAILFHELNFIKSLELVIKRKTKRPMLADLGVAPGSRFCGIDPNRQAVANAAIDLLTAQLYRNEYGLPTYPKTVCIEGRWVENGQETK